MCGIVGYSVQHWGKTFSDILKTSREQLKHRGPDDFGDYENATCGIGLGHTRLAILDSSSSGHQPMASDDGEVVLVFNGEIYNYIELRDLLVTEGCTFKGSSDTEVLLNLYLTYRRKAGDLKLMLRRLNGIFAFGLWDGSKGGLLLARDAIGVKPCYYSLTEYGFAFASELKALRPYLGKCLPREKTQFDHINVESLNRYMSFLWCPGDGTPHSEVHKVGPGEAIWVRNGKIDERFIWYQLPVMRGITSSVGQESMINGTASFLRRAVHRQMVSDVPVGSFLSGGLDSSSIVAFARELNPEIRCFTIENTDSNEDGFIDDLPYARRVAKHLDVPLEVVGIDSARMVEDLPKMVAQLDEPLADLAPLNILYISEIARQQGVKVLLSGAGGDDLFSGYRRHQALVIEKFWSWLPQRVRLELKKLTYGLDQRRPLFRRLRKFASNISLNGHARLVEHFRWIDQSELESLYTRDFRMALAGSRAEEPLFRFLNDMPPAASRMEQMLALEQRFFLADHNLNYTDKMSMAVGVEVRVPFLDLDLVEFAASIPSELKYRLFEGKWVLKKAMEGYLPHDVIYRPKTGFGAPLRKWMRSDLRGLLVDVIGSQSFRSRGIFDHLAVENLIRNNDQGRVDASYTLLSLMCIELWCRENIDRGYR